jgi:ComF family protein
VFFARPLPSLPSLCAVCHGWGALRICSTCVARHTRLTPRCARCALAVPGGVTLCGHCSTHPPHFDAACAAVDYDFPWDGLIQQFKFHAALDLSAVLAGLLTHALREARSAPTPLPAATLIVPVPLSAPRLRERGYNQAWELARRVAQALRTPADAQLLLRTKDTAHQLSLPPPERAANVRGAFAVEPLRRAAIAGQHIAVVDDVMTTGATLAEAAHVLKQAGAASVQVWVLARTPSML